MPRNGWVVRARLVFLGFWKNLRAESLERNRCVPLVTSYTFIPGWTPPPSPLPPPPKNKVSNTSVLRFFFFIVRIIFSILSGAFFFRLPHWQRWLGWANEDDWKETGKNNYCAASSKALGH